MTTTPREITYERIPEERVEGKPLGRHLEHDPMSRAFAFRAPATVTLHSVRHTRRIPALDQGQVGSCTGNALVHALSADPFLATYAPTQTFEEGLAQSFYHVATTLDAWAGEWPSDDTGSSGLAVAKGAQQYNWISGYQAILDFNSALAALMARPVIVGQRWYSSFDNPAASGEVTRTTSASVRGGHETCFDELDVARQRVWFTNSWGPGWGLSGRAWMSWATFDRLVFSENGDVMSLVPRGAAKLLPSVDVLAHLADLAKPAPPPVGHGLLHRLRESIHLWR
jgi:hypothetical protein